LERNELPDYVSEGLAIEKMPEGSPFVQALLPACHASYPLDGLVRFQNWVAGWRKKFKNSWFGADVEGYYIFFKSNELGERRCYEFHNWAKDQKLCGFKTEFVYVSMQESQLIKAGLHVVSCP
jgi:hypothetical protein